MNKYWLWISIALILAVPAFAALEVPPLTDNTSIENLLTDILQPIFQKLNLLVGGIFGLYFILTIVRIHYERKKARLLADIRKDVDLLTQHFGVKHSHLKKNIFKRIVDRLIPDQEENKKSRR